MEKLQRIINTNDIAAGAMNQDAERLVALLLGHADRI